MYRIFYLLKGAVRVSRFLDTPTHLDQARQKRTQDSWRNVTCRWLLENEEIWTEWVPWTILNPKLLNRKPRGSVLRPLVVERLLGRTLEGTPLPTDLYSPAKVLTYPSYTQLVPISPRNPQGSIKDKDRCLRSRGKTDFLGHVWLVNPEP